MGYEPLVINYGYKTAAVAIKSPVEKILERIRYLFSSNSTLLQKIQYNLNKKNRVQAVRIFTDFYRSNLPMNSTNKATFDDLLKSPPECDCYITGSDQVWNPNIHNNMHEPCCFLHFAESNAKKIAYAPSFGVRDLPEDLGSLLADELKDFDAISVREKSGAQIIKKYAAIDAEVVLDPTLMADNDIWDSIAKLSDNVPDEYIFVYRFGNMKVTDKAVDYYRKKLKLPVIEMPVSIHSYGHRTKVRHDIGPAEFLGLIKNAKLVLTDSFHASVFSILFKTPFFSFLRQKAGEASNMNGRILELLDTFALNDRLITNSNVASRSTADDINFTRTYEILKEKRADSQKFLECALKGDNKTSYER